MAGLSGVLVRSVVAGVRQAKGSSNLQTPALVLPHVVGLDHVQDKGELMYPETQTSVTDYQPGDRRGLALLGSGPCTPML